MMKMNKENIKKLKKIMNNPIWFIETFMRIPDKNQKIVKFKLNDMQKDYLKNKDTYNIILKARQGGMTVVNCALALYYCITTANTDCLMLSHTDESTRKIFNKLKVMYRLLPDIPIIKPELVRNNRQELAFTNGSTISCHTMGKKDVGRGSTLRLIHLSEFAFVGEQAERQLLSLEQALAANGTLTIETTANGLNYFHNLYYKAKHKENAYKCFFYNYIDTSCMFQDEYKKYKRIYKNIHHQDLTIEDLTPEEKELMAQYEGMNLDILTWRRLKIANSSVEQFNQEFPISDDVAFVSSGSGVFDNAKIMERMRNIRKEEYLELNNISKDLPIQLKQYYGRSFFMYKNVKSHMKYYIGVDSGEGIGQDYSTIVVFDADGEECAMFKNNKIKPYVFAEIVNLIGRYFNKALLVVERASAGHTVIEKLRYEYNYMNMLKYKTYDLRGKKHTKIGFETSAKSKGLIINNFREMFDTEGILIHSKDILAEMKVFVVDDKGSMNAMRGYHDDLVMATAMALEGLRQGVQYSWSR